MNRLAVFVFALGGLAAFAGEGKISHPFLCADMGLNKVLQVGADGKVEWEFPAQQSMDVWRLANGNILFAHSRGAKEVSQDKKVVWEYKAEGQVEIFSCQPLPNGNVLVGEAGPCRLIEVDREGKIQKEIKMETKIKGTHGQFRICRKTPAGTYLVAFVSEGQVREYSADGQLTRTIKVPGNPFVAVRLPDGNTLIACGDGHKLIEVDAQDKIVWQINENDLPDNPLRFVAGVQRLPNGNTVVANWLGHGNFVGKQPQIFEVTRDKQVVWQVFDPQFRLITNLYLLDVPGDPAKGEILR